MKEVAEKTANIAIPWFDETSTPHGLAKVLLTLTKDRNAHTLFELGCCYATIGLLGPARKHLCEAARLFQAWYDEFPECAWALVERDLAEQLGSAITDSAHVSLLSEWRKQTILNLKLDKLYR